MSSIKYTKDFQIKQPIEAVFPLFSAEGETLWVPGWAYKNIMGSTDLHENYIFLTHAHDHASTEAIWLVKRFDPEAHLVEFYKVEPQDKVGVITVECQKLADALTEVQVSYQYIGLSDKGNQFIDTFTPSDYEEFISEWKTLLEKYFDSLT